jgi:cobalt-zinc-cadmium efflux system outer membrane protein
MKRCESFSVFAFHPGPESPLDGTRHFDGLIVVWLILAGFAIALLLTGCVGIRTAGERETRVEQQSVAAVYRPGGGRPELPVLSTNSPMAEFLLYAMLNQPQVEAAYYDWVAAVQRITVERSLPDPKLTFKTDVADLVMSLMPGLMMDFPGPGKLRAAAGVATAESRGKYFAFEASVLQTAFALKRAYYQLHFLDSKIGVNRRTLAVLADLEKLARTQNEVGKATLQDVLRAQIEQERLNTEIANLEDSRRPLGAQFKAALGLTDTQADPPVPARFETTPLDMTSERLFADALLHNPRLKGMEADVRRAEASLAVAYKARVPDFSLGLEADALAAPTVFTPQAAMTLPIWRDKISAQIATAHAGTRSAEARLSAEQIALAVEFAEKSFMFRESSRNLTLLRERLLPRARQSLEVGRGAYLSGQLDFLNLMDAQRTLLEFEISEVEARTQRELVLAELSLSILGDAPKKAPILGRSSFKPRTN